MKKTAKILSIILSISMILGVTVALSFSAFAADAPVFEIKKVSAANGQLVTSINLKSGTFNSLDMAFRTTGLKCTKIENSSNQPSGVLLGSTNADATGEFSNISVVATSGYSQKGEVYVVKFDITAEKYSFNIEVTSCSITDSNSNNKDVTASVTVLGAIEATTTTNGLLKDPDSGKWMFYENGKINYDYVGLAKNQYGWWYVKNGTIDFSYVGLAKNAYGWWYIQNGTINYSFKGLAKNQYGWWYVANGTIDYSYVGLAKNAYGWWYVQNGTINYSFKGLAKNQYGWWYIQNGTINYSFKGLAKNQYGWWYVKNGTIDFGYNGYASNQYGTWKVVNGKVVGK